MATSKKQVSPSCLTMKLVSSDSLLGILMLDMRVKTLFWYMGTTAWQEQDKPAVLSTQSHIYSIKNTILKNKQELLQ